MKIRYVVKNKHTGVTYFNFYDISQVEVKGLGNLFPVDDYDILSRDLIHPLEKDKHGNDLYENDVIEYRDRENQIVSKNMDFGWVIQEYCIEIDEITKIGNIYKIEEDLKK